MDLFQTHGTEIYIIRPSQGLEPHGSVRAILDQGRAHISGDATDVQRGDILRATLANGNLEHWVVREVTVYPGGPLANIDLRIERCEPPRTAAPGSVVAMGNIKDETWVRRDLPILRAALQLHEADAKSPDIAPEGIAQLTGFDLGAVQVGIRALENDGLLVGVRRGANSDAWLIDGVSGEGRRRAGAWPSHENAVYALINALRDVANDTSRGDEERSTARRILDAIGSFGSDVGAGVLAAVMARLLGA